MKLFFAKDEAFIRQSKFRHPPHALPHKTKSSSTSPVDTETLKQNLLPPLPIALALSHLA